MKTFTDPISGQTCVLIVPADGTVYAAAGEPKIGVEHPGCTEIADLEIPLDAFFCTKCHWNGRISGIWAMDVIEHIRSQ